MLQVCILHLAGLNTAEFTQMQANAAGLNTATNAGQKIQIMFCLIVCKAMVRKKVSYHRIL
jgi:hypothetical protein